MASCSEVVPHTSRFFRRGLSKAAECPPQSFSLSPSSLISVFHSRFGLSRLMTKRETWTTMLRGEWRQFLWFGLKVPMMSVELSFERQPRLLLTISRAKAPRSPSPSLMLYLLPRGTCFADDSDAIVRSSISSAFSSLIVFLPPNTNNVLLRSITSTVSSYSVILSNTHQNRKIAQCSFWILIPASSIYCDFYSSVQYCTVVIHGCCESGTCIILK